MQQQNLVINDGVDAQRVRQFVMQRLQDPLVFEEHDVVVFNFHNSSPVEPEIREFAERVPGRYYVIPYGVSGVWAAVQMLLPAGLMARADYAAYSERSESYVSYTNLLREVSDYDGAQQSDFLSFDSEAAEAVSEVFPDA